MRGVSAGGERRRVKFVLTRWFSKPRVRREASCDTRRCLKCQFATVGGYFLVGSPTRLGFFLCLFSLLWLFEREASPYIARHGEAASLMC